MTRNDSNPRLGSDPVSPVAELRSAMPADIAAARRKSGFHFDRQGRDRAGRRARAIFRLLPAGAWLAMLSLLVATSGAFAAEARKPNVADLIEGMKSSEVAVRRDASYRISQLGAEAPGAVPQLIVGLDDQDSQVWFNSITALARIGPAAVEALPALMKELEEAGGGRYREQAWYRASYALGSLGPAALPTLVKALDHERERVRSGAAKAIGWIGADATEAIPSLAKRLGDSSAAVREQSAEALGRIGPAALPVLKAALKSDQAPARAAAATSLEWMGAPAREANLELAAALKSETDDPARARMIHALSRLDYVPAEFLPLVVPLLRSESAEVRQEASNALILMEPAATTSVPVLKEMLGSSDPAAIEMAVTFLGAIGPDAGGAVPELVALRSQPESPAELSVAIDATLVQIGPPTVPALVKVMNGARGDPNHWSVQCLRNLGPAAVPAMIASLESSDPARQRDAIQVLSLVGEAAEPAIPALKQLAESGSRDVKGPALVALALAGASPEIVLPLAENALNERTVASRRSGGTALAALGARARPALTSLVDGLADKDAVVAIESARALGSLGSAASPAIEPLIAAVDRPEPAVQEAAVKAIGRLGEVARAAVPTLAKLLPSTRPPLQVEVATALGAMGSSAREALPGLEQSLASSDPATRTAALTAYARIEPDNSRKVERLKQALDDAAQPVRVAAIGELGKLGRAAEPAAEKLYGLTENSTEREQALEVLGGMRIRSVPLLVRAMGNSDPYVRQYAAERLGQLGAAAKDAVPDLRKLLEDNEDFVKRTARASLREIERAK